MRTLVTGGCGFIGSHIVDRLVERGDTVTVIDSECADNDVFYKNPGATYVKEDILNSDVMHDLAEGKDIIFHLAAESRIGPTIEDPRKACMTNVLGTCTVLQAARDKKVGGVVYSSTSACYGLKNSSPMHEEMPTDNLNPYSTSKIAGEDLCVMFSKLFQVPTVCLRYFNVFGERMPSRGQYAPVLAIFLRQAEANEALTVVGDGEQRRDFIYVGDIAQANLLAADNAGRCAGRVYNVGSGRNISVVEIARMFEREIKFLPSRPGEAMTTQASLERIKRDLNFTPRVPVEGWLTSELKRRSLL